MLAPHPCHYLRRYLSHHPERSLWVNKVGLAVGESEVAVLISGLPQSSTTDLRERPSEMDGLGFSHQHDDIAWEAR